MSLAHTESPIVLVHGAFQKGACWSRVKAVLTEKGQHVLTPDLPGRESDPTAAQKLTVGDYRDALLNIISTLPSPVLLAGHSFGGITISSVAEAAPEKILALIYLSAYLPQDGQSMRDLAATDADSRLAKDGNFVMTPDYAFASIKPDQAGQIFATDASLDDRGIVAKSLIREPLAPMGGGVRLSAERFGRVPKYYISTTQDAVVSPALQDRMIAGAPIQRVFKLEAGHASYFTKPHEVAGIVLSVRGERQTAASARS